MNGKCFSLLVAMLSDVFGQDQAVAFLRKVAQGTLLKPLLLVGQEGVGRRFAVLQLVQEVFCRAERQKSCTCMDCLQLVQGIHPDLMVVTAPMEKEIGIDPVREVVEQTVKYPVMAPVRFIFIDGADRMTAPAANAILKTLEEPPPTIRFILSAESYEGVIPTIRSRCGRVGFNNLPESFINSTLSRYEPDAGKALVYSRIAGGSVGRAIRFWASNRLKLRDHMLTAIEHGLRGDVSAMFSVLDELGADLPTCIPLLEHLAFDFLVSPVNPNLMVNVDVAERIQQLRTQAQDSTWVKFREGLRILHERYQRSNINVLFHVKSALVNSLV